MLKQAIEDYLLWMISTGYSQPILDSAERVLQQFSVFITHRQVPWESIFTYETLKSFQKEICPLCASAVRGLSKHLFMKKKISRPIPKKAHTLSRIYEEYICWYGKVRTENRSFIFCITRVLAALDKYLQKREIPLAKIKIEQLDAFLGEYTASYSAQTKRTYRSVLRGFLRYLCHEKGIIKKDLSSLLIGAPVYAQAKPPKFLRPREVEKLFSNADILSVRGLRRYAILYLAFTLGLRPKEIRLIRLDDISFGRMELRIRERKNTSPIKLPLCEDSIKAIAAYVVGARPKSSDRHLFLRFRAPFLPISASMVCYEITAGLRAAHLPGSAYWLRHTYAQRLLESGASIFEIKQMLGHESIQSSRRYIHINTKLMREVIFDETL
jgi:integrase/recombinase XerD